MVDFFAYLTLWLVDTALLVIVVGLHSTLGY